MCSPPTPAVQNAAPPCLDGVVRYVACYPAVWHGVDGVQEVLRDPVGAAAAAREAVRLAPAEPEDGRERDLRAE